MHVGYAIGTQQGLEQQTHALRNAGCERLFTDIIRGSGSDRQGFKHALASLNAGDVLVVWRLDRLAQSQERVLDIIAALHERRVGLVSLVEDVRIMSRHDDVLIRNIDALADFSMPEPHHESPAHTHEDEHEHGHVHAHSADEPAFRIPPVVLGVVTLAMIGLLYLFCFHLLPSYDKYTGRVVGVRVTSTAGNEITQQVQVLVTSGNLDGKVYSVPNTYPTGFPTDGFSRGDNVLLDYNSTSGGVFIDNYDRRGMTFTLLLILLVLIVLVARQQGIMSVISMSVSIVVIMQFVIPNVLAGHNPLLYAIMSAFVIIPTTYYLAHGFQRKTTVAIISTLVTLALTLGLAAVFVHLMKLPPVTTASEAASYYTPSGGIIDSQSLYLAALVIGALAVLNDITVSQASVVTSLHRANPSMGLNTLVLRAMDVGKDHIASLINTLLLVYVGASFTLVISVVQGISTNTFGVSDPAFSADLVRTVIMSIGVVIAVPVSTYVAAYLTLHRMLASE